MIAGLMLLWGWRAAFIIPGALGLVWLVVWLWIYRLPEHLAGISQEELAWIRNENSQGVASASASGPPTLGRLIEGQKRASPRAVPVGV
jgi:ACS family hexuronate transporter-like MFS transporter